MKTLTARLFQTTINAWNKTTKMTKLVFHVSWAIFLLTVFLYQFYPIVMHKEQRLTQTIRYLQTIETNLDIYKIDHGQYPSQKAGLNALVGKYIRYLKKDSWGNSFIYETSAEDRKPLIRSVGPDGIDDSGTRDDVISTEKVYECEYFGSCTSIGEVIVIFLVPLTAILIITLALLLMAEIIPTIYFFSYSYLTKRKDKKVE